MRVLGQIKHSSRGFSLVELMVAMLLSLMLVLGAVSVYLASSRTYSEVEQVAVLSENGRFALQVVSDSLRHTGFFGRVPAARVELAPDLSAVVGDCTGNSAAYDLANYLFSTSSDATGNAIGCIDDAVPLTDVLVIKHVAPQSYCHDICAGGEEGEGEVGGVEVEVCAVPYVGPPANGSYVMTNNILGRVFNCGDGSPLTGVGGDIPDGVVWEYQMEVYYIRNGIIPTLSRKYLEWNGAAMEVKSEDMVEGVENMQLLFGFDSSTDGDVDTYGNADAVVDADGGALWSSVQAIEIHLLLRSTTPDGSYSNDKTYTLADMDPLTPDDSYRRLLINTRISLRNPKLVVRGGA